MINHITGIITTIVDDDRVIVSVGPIGFICQMPRAGTLVLNEKVTIYIYMHWTQESGPTLFGFKGEDERALFSLIIGCSGVGPKLAIGLLSDMAPSLFIKAVQSGDIERLSSVSGIGKKKAEHLLVYLKHRIEKLVALVDASSNEELVMLDQKIGELAEALKALHYSKTEITDALFYLREKKMPQQMTFDHLMRHALSFLSKRI